MNSRVFALALIAMSYGSNGETLNVSDRLERIRERHGVPGMAAAAVRHGRIFATGAAGLRKAGGDEMVTLDDRWHLGSCTKSMTAALVAMLVEDGALRWDSSIGEILSDIPMEPAWCDVTLEQLLQHRGGAPQDPPPARAA